jgi:hypothetical protein
MPRPYNPKILDYIDVLAGTGSHFRTDAMDDPCLEELGFLMLTPQGDVAHFSKSEMLDEFGSRCDAGAPPLSTEKRVPRIEERGEEATATPIPYRRMSRQEDPGMYELRLRMRNGKWLVAAEMALPWPDMPTVKGFPPPRTG